MLLCSLCRKYASAMVEYAAAPRQGQLGETGLNATTPPSSLSTIPMLQHTGKLFDNRHFQSPGQILDPNAPHVQENRLLLPNLSRESAVRTYHTLVPFSPCSHISLQRVCPVCPKGFSRTLAGMPQMTFKAQ